LSTFVELKNDEMMEVDGGLGFTSILGAISTAYFFGTAAGWVINQTAPACPDCGGRHWWW